MAVKKKKKVVSKSQQRREKVMKDDGFFDRPTFRKTAENLIMEPEHVEEAVQRLRDIASGKKKGVIAVVEIRELPNGKGIRSMGTSFLYKVSALNVAAALISGLKLDKFAWLMGFKEVYLGKNDNDHEHDEEGNCIH